ncbi:MAG: glycosyltransferase [Bacteroidia bacterium]|nr:glycosyltransferase [Bacteroidia bacterium]
MTKQKHILFISSWYPNKNNVGHGIFNFNFAKAAALNNRVSVIHVSSNSGQTQLFELEEKNTDGFFEIQVYYKKVESNIPLWSNWLKIKRQKQGFDLAYERLLQKGAAPDLIQLNVVIPAGFGAMHLAKKHRLPYIVNESWSGYCAEDGNYKGFLLKLITKKIIRHAKAILPVSNFLKQAMLSQGLSGNYKVLPNVVDTSRFVPMPKPEEPVTRFIHISSLTNREKNIDGIIKAFTKALKINEQMELWIVGDGEEREKWQTLAKISDKKGRISFKGRLQSNNLVEAINQCDALLMFSYFETFCLVITEAWACGKPVITSNAGAIKDYMQPEFGVMVEKGNEAELTKAILDFAANKKKYNSDKMRTFVVENFSPEKVAAGLNNVYDEVLGEGRD